DEDLRTLWERFGVRISAADTSSFDFYRAMKIEDLRVRLERDTWVRSTSNPEMDIQITGDLDVSKEHNSQEASVFGTIQVLPARSRIIQFGRRFNISAGTLTFNGPAESPRMDLEAEYDVPSRRANATEVTIRLLVTGTPQDLEVEFQSDPQMELADIVSYIATGRPASESLQIGQNQSGTYLQSAAGIAIGQVRDLIQDLAGQNLGLDVIEITQNSTQGMTVTAGKYVTPEFYVAVSQPLSVGSGSERSGATSESTTQVAMEYEIVQQLLLSLMNRGTILRVTLRWEYAF
ncbi:MAG: translocation/assembly module TamB, partial [Rhodothermales bacterium]|nr:translocation/assembly module TamB [Rhodothermales bacterium]